MSALGTGEQPPDGDLASLLDYYPALRAPADCPLCGQRRCPCGDCAPPSGPYDLADVIIELNDRHKCSREQIADWIETL